MSHCSNIAFLVLEGAQDNVRILFAHVHILTLQRRNDGLHSLVLRDRRSNRNMRRLASK